MIFLKLWHRSIVIDKQGIVSVLVPDVAGRCPALTFRGTEDEKLTLVIYKFIMTGDTTQIDLPKRSESGLIQAMRILADIEGISIIRFDERDIVRHKLVKRIVRAYVKEENQKNERNKEL